MKLKARNTRPLIASDLARILDKTSITQSLFISAFWQIMEAEYKRDVCQWMPKWELQRQETAKIRYVSKRVSKALRSGGSITFRCSSLYYFSPNGAKRVKIVSVKDSTVRFVTHNELFYYFKSIKNSSGIGGDL